MDPDYGKQYRFLYENHWWWRAREDLLVDELRNRLSKKPGLSILDVGCGDALFFERLRQFGEVEGVESDLDLLDSREPNRERITVAPFDANFQPGKYYDLILMLDVLEHLDEPEKALRHGLSLLNMGGIIVITVPAFRMLWTQHDRLNKHRTRYTKRTFGRLARVAGMQVTSSRYFFIWLAAAKLVTRWLEAVLSGDAGVPKVPSPSVNRLLYRFSLAEEKLFKKLWTPIGSSLLVIGARIPEKA